MMTLQQIQDGKMADCRHIENSVYRVMLRVSTLFAVGQRPTVYSVRYVRVFYPNSERYRQTSSSSLNRHHSSFL